MRRFARFRDRYKSTFQRVVRIDLEIVLLIGSRPRAIRIAPIALSNARLKVSEKAWVAMFTAFSRAKVLEEPGYRDDANIVLVLPQRRPFSSSTPTMVKLCPLILITLLIGDSCGNKRFSTVLPTTMTRRASSTSSCECFARSQENTFAVENAVRTNDRRLGVVFTPL